MKKRYVSVPELVFEYFYNLGYSPAQIKTNVRLKTNEADIIVYENNNPFIVVEYKQFNMLPREEELKYNPHVSQLQLMALACKASYYVLTNGQVFLWFQTDEAGRPELLKEPVRQRRTLKVERPNKEGFIQILKEILYNFYNQGYQKRDLAILLLGWIQNKKELSDLKDSLIRSNLIKETIEIYPILNVSDSTRINKVFEMLNSININSLTSKEILSSLDDVFFIRERSQRVPRWLSDFLIRLSQFKDDIHLVDLFSNYGNVLVSALMHNITLKSITEICINHESALWSNLQQKVLEKENISVKINSSVIDLSDIWDIKLPSSTTNIISVPPFGRYEGYFSNSRLYRSVFIPDLSLEFAIKALEKNGRIVMVVPEALLFDEGRRKLLRELIIQSVRLTAVISLPAGTFLPYSNIKTSILVLDKMSYIPNNYEVFMAEIRKPVLKDTFDCREIKEIRNVLEAFLETDQSSRELENAHYFRTPLKELDINDFTVFNYIPHKLLTTEKISFPYTPVPLYQLVVRISKGRRLKFVDEGTSVIVPKAIRPMTILSGELRYTEETLENSSAITVQSGDIVFSCTEPFLGAAAVITEEMHGKFINQDVILIRPDLSKVLPEYLAAALNSDYVRHQIQTKTMSRSLHLLSLRKIYDIAIPLPSLEIQQRIAENIEMKKNELENTYKIYKKAELEFLGALQRLEGWDIT